MLNLSGHARKWIMYQCNAIPALFCYNLLLTNLHSHILVIQNWNTELHNSLNNFKPVKLGQSSFQHTWKDSQILFLKRVAFNNAT